MDTSAECSGAEQREGPFTWNAEERLRAAGDAHPRRVERALDALDFPQVVEELEVLHHRGRVEHRVDGRVDLVLEREHVPPDLPVRVLEHARVEAPEHVGRVVLCV